MILRVYRARAAAADRRRLLSHLRDHVYPANVGTDGLRTFQAGLRELGDGSVELALVSTWADFPALLAGIGGDILRPRWLEPVREHVEPVSADHYELVGEELRGIVPLAGGALRIFTGRLVDHGGEAFFAFARRAQTTQLDSGEMLVTHIGRRIDEQGGDAVYVAVWRDAAAPSAQGGSEDSPANRDQWTAFFSAWQFAAYDAIARVPSRPGSEQLLLLADDERRIVFASPSARDLLGRPPARMLGRRVEDVTSPEVREDFPARWAAFLARGSEAAELDLQHADGHIIAVRCEARANVPWPGVHASVLSPCDQPIDFDQALAAAGLVARYGPFDGDGD